MFTSDRMDSIRTASVYTGISLFTALFGAIYEHFSFGVYSYFMIYAFEVPLITALLYLQCGMFSKHQPTALTNRYAASAVAAITTGMAATGVVQLYGTENRLLFIYYIAGAMFLILSVISHIKSIRDNTVTSSVE